MPLTRAAYTGPLYITRLSLGNKIYDIVKCFVSDRKGRAQFPLLEHYKWRVYRRSADKRDAEIANAVQLRQSPLSQLTVCGIEPGGYWSHNSTVCNWPRRLWETTRWSKLPIQTGRCRNQCIDALSDRLNGCKRWSRWQCLMTSFAAESNSYQPTHLGLLLAPTCAGSAIPQTHCYTR